MRFHRTYAALAATVVLCCLAVPAAADTISLTRDFSLDEPDDDLTAHLYLTMTPVGATNPFITPRLFEGEYDDSDAGSTFTATGADPTFAHFETLLTNGDFGDVIWVGLEGEGGSGSASGNAESGYGPLPNPGTDLAGFDVTAISLTFNTLAVTKPTSDTVAANFNATITIEYEALTIVPTPTAALSGLGLMGLLALRRRSA